MKKIERVKLDEDLKPIKSISIIGIVFNILSLLIIIFSYISIWKGGIYIKILLTMFLTSLIIYNSFIKEK